MKPPQQAQMLVLPLFVVILATLACDVSGAIEKLAVGNTPTPVPSRTPQPTWTAPPSPTPTWTPTQTYTPVPTRTATPTATPTPIYFRLINRHTQMCLTAQVGSHLIVQETCSDSRDEQFWRLPLDAEFVNLQSRSGVCIGYNNYNNRLVQVGCSAIQPWRLIPFAPYYQAGEVSIRLPHGTSPTVVPKELGLYYLIQYQDHCVDVDSWNHDEGGSIIHETCRGCDNDNQLWARY